MIKKIGQRLKDQRGLTLVELLAVVVILGIIAAIAVPSIGNVIAKSKFDAAKADAVQLLNAGKLYVAANGNPSVEESVDEVEGSILEEYIEITGDHLNSYTVKIGKDGKVTIDAIANHNDKSGNPAKFKGTIAEVNGLTYDETEVDTGGEDK